MSYFDAEEFTGIWYEQIRDRLLSNLLGDCITLTLALDEDGSLNIGTDEYVKGAWVHSTSVAT